MDQDQFNFERIATAIEFISSNIKEQPSLEQIAEKVNISPFHFQKMFTEWAGVSPKKFQQFMTVSYAKKVLAEGKAKTLQEATSTLGLSSTSRLHDLFVKIEGMTPAEYKNGGRNLTIQYSIRHSPFGKYLVASTGKGISNLFFFEGAESTVVTTLQGHWAEAKIKAGTDNDQEKVFLFFNNFTSNGDIKLHLKGTAFQIKVWEALLKIPQGELTTYGTLASNIHYPNASRAVGTAIGSNQVGFLIPCHRVIKSAGAIGEFRWGSHRKMAMIGWEASRLTISDGENLSI